jgi:5-methylcytosine-specific restriction endonuclease McrA
VAVAIPAACLSCGQQTANGSYCARCAPAVEARRHNRAYDTPAWRRFRNAAVAAHVRAHGWICPGYNRPAHPSRDLTVDHPVALAAGGALLQDEAPVLCRACNSAKGTR